MEGKSLSPLPSSQTTYQEFKKQYPHGKLLAKSDKAPYGSSWESYQADSSELGLFGRPDNFKRLKGKDIVYGVRLEGKQVAVSLDYLSKKQFALLDQYSPPVVLTFDVTSGTVAAFSLPALPADSSELVCADDKITLSNGPVAWDARTGRLVNGRGDDLTPRPVTSAFWFAWATFYPNTELLK